MDTESDVLGSDMKSEPDLDGAFSADGVNLSVIRWMLGLTPAERLQAVQGLIDAVWALRVDEA